MLPEEGIFAWIAWSVPSAIQKYQLTPGYRWDTFMESDNNKKELINSDINFNLSAVSPQCWCPFLLIQGQEIQLEYIE